MLKFFMEKIGIVQRMDTFCGNSCDYHPKYCKLGGTYSERAYMRVCRDGSRSLMYCGCKRLNKRVIWG